MTPKWNDHAYCLAVIIAKRSATRLVQNINACKALMEQWLMVRIRWLKTTILVLALPLALRFLFSTFDRTGLVPYMIFQLYYLPLGSWLGRPFFNHDSELGILVLPLGAVATAMFYTVIIIIIDRSFIWLHERNSAHRS